MAGNDLLVGWKAIAAFLGCSERSIRGYRGPLLEGGRIFYRRRRRGKKNSKARAGVQDFGERLH